MGRGCLRVGESRVASPSGRGKRSSQEVQRDSIPLQGGLGGVPPTLSFFPLSCRRLTFTIYHQQFWLRLHPIYLLTKQVKQNLHFGGGLKQSKTGRLFGLPESLHSAPANLGPAGQLPGRLRGQQGPSPTLLRRMTQTLVRPVDSFVIENSIPVVHFEIGPA